MAHQAAAGLRRLRPCLWACCPPGWPQSRTSQCRRRRPTGRSPAAGARRRSGPPCGPAPPAARPAQLSCVHTASSTGTAGAAAHRVVWCLHGCRRHSRRHEGSSARPAQHRVSPVLVGSPASCAGARPRSRRPCLRAVPSQQGAACLARPTRCTPAPAHLRLSTKGRAQQCHCAHVQGPVPASPPPGRPPARGPAVRPGLHHALCVSVGSSARLVGAACGQVDVRAGHRPVPAAVHQAGADAVHLCTGAEVSPAAQAARCCIGQDRTYVTAKLWFMPWNRRSPIAGTESQKIPPPSAPCPTS